MKIGFLITARLKSTRLPLKLLLDLSGKTVIERVIDRAKEVKGISEIVLCTSTDSQDLPLVEIAKEMGIYYFNGDPDDVLRRLTNTARFYKMDYFISITADNPLFSIEYANRLVDLLKREPCDFVKIEGLPLGVAVYGINTKAAETVCEIKNIVDTEIWGALLDQPHIFNVKKLLVTDNLKRSNLRLTLDYEEDYILIKNIYKNIKFQNTINLYDVMDYLHTHPHVVEINSNCIQRDISSENREKIDQLYSENDERIKKIKNDIYSKL